MKSLTLHLLTPVDWTVLRSARLAALDESPHAFMSRYEHERRLPEAEWRRAFDASRWIVAQEDKQVIGLARSVGEPSAPHVRYLESIWVAPGSRHRGVFRGLLHRLVEVERQTGVTHLLLWVMEDNHPARRAYAAVGFQPTGKRQLLHELGRFELQLRLELIHQPGLAN